MKLPKINLSTTGSAIVAIADRGLLGAVTFLTSIFLGRWGGPGELGLFAIFFSLVFFALSLQESLVIAPYSVFAASQADGAARRRYLGGVLHDSGLLGAVIAALFLAGATALWALGWPRAASISLILAFAAPCIVLREFARRIVYTDFKPQTALAISAVVSVLQLGLMGALHAGGRLTAATSFAAMGVSSLIGGGGWVLANRKLIEFGGGGDRHWYRDHWLMGKWLLAAQAGEIARINMLPWLLALATDEATVGIYAACSFVASLPTPLHVAVSNMLVPQLAHVERRSGLLEAGRLVRQATGWLTAIMVGYSAAVILVSDRLVPWIYGAEFTNTQHTLIVLVIAWAITGATLPAARALLVIDRASQTFWSQFAGIAVNLALGVPMVAVWGAPGAAYAALIGSALKGGLSSWWYVDGMRRLRNASGSAAPRQESLGRRELEWATSTPRGLASGEAP